jgi:hypothetical protein
MFHFIITHCGGIALKCSHPITCRCLRHGSQADAERCHGTVSAYSSNGLINPLLIHKDNSRRQCLILHGIVVPGVCQMWSQQITSKVEWGERT